MSDLLFFSKKNEWFAISPGFDSFSLLSPFLCPQFCSFAHIKTSDLLENQRANSQPCYIESLLTNTVRTLLHDDWNPCWLYSMLTLLHADFTPCCADVTTCRLYSTLTLLYSMLLYSMLIGLHCMLTNTMLTLLHEYLLTLLHGDSTPRWLYSMLLYSILIWLHSMLTYTMLTILHADFVFTPWWLESMLTFLRDDWNPC